MCMEHTRHYLISEEKEGKKINHHHQLMEDSSFSSSSEGFNLLHPLPRNHNVRLEKIRRGNVHV